jgi:hypothetical protein
LTDRHCLDTRDIADDDEEDQDSVLALVNSVPGSAPVIRLHLPGLNPRR